MSSTVLSMSSISRSVVRWPLLLVSVLSALSMGGIGCALSVSSPGSPWQLFVVLALVCIAAVVPFFVPSSRTAIVLARIVISLEGVLVGAVAIGMESMADVIVSMGNSHNSELGPFAYLGIMAGLMVILLGLIAAPAPPKDFVRENSP